MATEILRNVLARAEISYSISVLPWARAYRTARDEPNTLIYSIFKMESRKDQFKWIRIDGLSTEMYLFRPRARTDIDICELDQARAYRVGVTRDSSTHHFLLAHGFKDGENVFPVHCEEQNLLQSDPAYRRIDLSTGDLLSLAWWLKKVGYPADYLVKQVFLFRQNFYLAFSLDTDDEVVERVRAALAELQEEGVVRDILDRYYEEYGISVEERGLPDEECLGACEE